MSRSPLPSPDESDTSPMSSLDPIETASVSTTPSDPPSPPLSEPSPIAHLDALDRPWPTVLTYDGQDEEDVDLIDANRINALAARLEIAYRGSKHRRPMAVVMHRRRHPVVGIEVIPDCSSPCPPLELRRSDLRGILRLSGWRSAWMVIQVGRLR